MFSFFSLVWKSALFVGVRRVLANIHGCVQRSYAELNLFHSMHWTLTHRNHLNQFNDDGNCWKRRNRKPNRLCHKSPIEIGNAVCSVHEFEYPFNSIAGVNYTSCAVCYCLVVTCFNFVFFLFCFVSIVWCALSIDLIPSEKSRDTKNFKCRTLSTRSGVFVFFLLFYSVHT